MKGISKITALCCALTPAAFASQLYFDARNDAMGGAGVASSNFVTAAFVNPALMGQGNNDHLGIIIPVIPYSNSGQSRYAPTSLGLQTQSPTALLTALDNVNNTRKAYEKDNNLANSSAYAAALTAVDGQRMSFNAGSSFAITLPSRGLSLAFFGNSYTSNVATAKVDPNDLVLINNQNLVDLNSSINVAGVGVSDLGLALSMNWDANIAKVSIGIAPKYQRIDSYSYDISVAEGGLRQFEQDFSDGLEKQSHFNIDAGIAFDFYDIFRVAVSGRNMLKKDLEITTPAYAGIGNADEQLVYTLLPLVTAGLALHHDYATLTAEMDLNDAVGFASNNDSRYARYGLEVNIYGYVQLRAGMRSDLNDIKDDIYTIGFGLSPGKLIHLDIAATVSRDGAYGIYKDGDFGNLGLTTGASPDDEKVYGIDGFIVQLSAKF